MGCNPVNGNFNEHVHYPIVFFLGTLVIPSFWQTRKGKRLLEMIQTYTNQLLYQLLQRNDCNMSQMILAVSGGGTKSARISLPRTQISSLYKTKVVPHPTNRKWVISQLYAD